MGGLLISLISLFLLYCTHTKNRDLVFVIAKLKWCNRNCKLDSSKLINFGSVEYCFGKNPAI